MTDVLAAILLAVVSAVCYASAAIVQERIAATTAPSRYALLRNGRWWAAVLLNGLGALLHVFALGLGPLAVVQPLGVLTIVFVTPLAALFVRRPVSAAGWRGVALVSVGLVAVLLVTGAHQSRRLRSTEQYAVVGVAAATVAVLVLVVVALAARGSRRPGVRSALLATASGVSYGTASVCVKTVAEGWALTSLGTAVPVFAFIALFAVTGLAASQASYRGGGLAAPLATATVVNPVVAAAVGIVLLQEGFRYGTPGMVTALVGALVTVHGLGILTRDATRRTASAKTLIPRPAEAGARSPGEEERSSPGTETRPEARRKVPARGRLDGSRGGTGSEALPYRRGRSRP
ncbi:DMT family transporter [Streptomyces oceani]|uniref:DMT family transporter n=1 Tax=Streptomyces oceani TaxID=1075402 RepID=UPI0008732F58|nr:DMT family transporter [Streptomyces oceani]